MRLKVNEKEHKVSNLFDLCALVAKHRDLGVLDFSLIDQERQIGCYFSISSLDLGYQGLVELEEFLKDVIVKIALTEKPNA